MADMTTGRKKQPAAKWYVSYAWGDDKTPESIARDQAVNELCNKAAAQGHTILRDKTVMHAGDRISEFMKQIGEGDLIFVIMSDKYLRSPYCMFELSEIWRTGKQESRALLDRVRLYKLPDAAIGTLADRLSWAKHWKAEYAAIKRQVANGGSELLGAKDHQEFRWMGGFYRQVNEILSTLADIVRPLTIEELLQYGLGGDTAGRTRAASPQMKAMPTLPARGKIGSAPAGRALAATAIPASTSTQQPLVQSAAPGRAGQTHPGPKPIAKAEAAGPAKRTNDKAADDNASIERPMIFISLAGQDEKIVLPIAERLRRNGFEVWTYHDNPAGTHYPSRVETLIRECACFILMASRNALGSVDVSREVQLAFQAKRPIIKVALDTAGQEAFGYQTAGLVHINLFHGDKDPNFKRLLASLAAYKPKPSSRRISGGRQIRDRRIATKSTAGQTSGTTVSDPASTDPAQASGESEEQIRIEIERSLRRLKTTIAAKLQTSPATMDALAAALSLEPTPPAAPKASADQRARDLVEQLMAMQFTLAKDGLRDSHRNLEDRGDKLSMTVLEDVSHYLVPLLYVADPRFKLDSLRRERIGQIVALPAGLPSFAEIVMAGIAARRIGYTPDRPVTVKDPYPLPRYGIELGPETGSVDLTEEQIRHDLRERLAISVYSEHDQAGEEVNAIRHRLRYWLTERNVRYYYIAQMPRIPAEAAALRAVLNRIAGRYPELAIVELDPRLRGGEIPLFDELRRLLGLREPIE